MLAHPTEMHRRPKPVPAGHRGAVSTPPGSAADLWQGAAAVLDAVARTEECAKLLALTARAQLGSTGMPVAPVYRDAILSLLSGDLTGDLGPRLADA